MSGRQRRALVWGDSLLVGAVGGVTGLALGTALAAAALRALGGDLGGGALVSTTPHLQWMRDGRPRVRRGFARHRFGVRRGLVARARGARPRAGAKPQGAEHGQ